MIPGEASGLKKRDLFVGGGGSGGDFPANSVEIGLVGISVVSDSPTPRTPASLQFTPLH